MDPTTLPQAAPVAAQGTNAPGGLPAAPVAADDDHDDELTRTRREAQSLRKRLRELEAAQTTAEQARAAQEAAALAEQGKFKELYEKAQATAAQETAARQAAERKALIAQVAQETGLPPALWSRVQGDDEAAIRADIAGLLPLVQAPAPAAPKPVSGLPVNGQRPSLSLTPPPPPYDPKNPPRLSQPGLFKNE